MYNKLFSKIVTSSIWLEPTPTRMIWITFLAVMDEDGFAPFASVANLAHTARIDLNEATEAVHILESPDENSGDKDHEGRRIERVPGGWMVLNASKYRDIVTRVVARERTRERVKRFRERKGGNALVTPANGHVTPSDSYPDPETKNLKSATSVADRREEAKTLWPRVLAAIQHDELRKSFPQDGDVWRSVAAIGGWRKLGMKPPEMRGQTEQKFLNAYAAL